MENGVELAKQKQINSQLSVLSSSIDVTEALTDDLENCLTSVLRDQEDEKDTPEKPSPNIVPLACNIRDQADRTHRINAALENILGRIELN